MTPEYCIWTAYLSKVTHVTTLAKIRSKFVVILVHAAALGAIFSVHRVRFLFREKDPSKYIRPVVCAVV